MDRKVKESTIKVKLCSPKWKPWLKGGPKQNIVNKRWPRVKFTLFKRWIMIASII